MVSPSVRIPAVGARSPLSDDYDGRSFRVRVDPSPESTGGDL